MSIKFFDTFEIIYFRLKFYIKYHEKYVLIIEWIILLYIALKRKISLHFFILKKNSQHKHLDLRFQSLSISSDGSQSEFRYIFLYILHGEKPEHLHLSNAQTAVLFPVSIFKHNVISRFIFLFNFIIELNKPQYNPNLILWAYHQHLVCFQRLLNWLELLFQKILMQEKSEYK